MGTGLTQGQQALVGAGPDAKLLLRIAVHFDGGDILAQSGDDAGCVGNAVVNASDSYNAIVNASDSYNVVVNAADSYNSVVNASQFVVNASQYVVNAAVYAKVFNIEHGNA